MKKSNVALLPGVLLLMAGLLNVLSVDFDDYTWLDITPAILFTIAGIIFILQALKKRKEQQNG